MFYSSKSGPTVSKGPTKSHDWFGRYGPVYEAVFFAKLLYAELGAGDSAVERGRRAVPKTGP